MKRDSLNERNKKIRDEFNQRREAGEQSKEIMQSLADTLFMAVDTVRKIVYEANYGEGYVKRILREVEVKRDRVNFTRLN